MAFPSIRSEVNSSETGNVTSHTVSLPTSPDIASGDTVLAGFACQASEDVGWPAGWTELNEVKNVNVTGAAAWHEGDGTEGSSITVTTGTSETSAHHVYSIQGAEDPDTQAPEYNSGSNNSSNFDATTLTPTGGAKDYLWLMIVMRHRGDTVSGQDSDYTTLSSNTTGTGSSDCSIYEGWHQTNAASENPTQFSFSSGRRQVWFNIAVHPGAGGTNYDDDISAAGTANEDFDAVSTVPGALSAAGTSGETQAGAATVDDSVSAAATASETAAAVVTAVASLSAAGTADETITAIADAVAALLADGIPAETAAAVVTVTSVLTAGGTANEAMTAAAQVIASISGSATAGETMVGGITYQDDFTGAATAAASFTGLMTAVASITAAGTASETQSAIASAIASLSEAGTAGEVITVVASAVAVISEGATAGESITGGTRYQDDWSAAATASAAFVGIRVALASITEAATAGEATTAAANAVADLVADGAPAEQISAAVTMIAALTANAVAGEGDDAVATAIAALLEAATAGETFVAPTGQQFADDIVAAAIAGASFGLILEGHLLATMINALAIEGTHAAGQSQSLDGILVTGAISAKHTVN